MRRVLAALVLVSAACGAEETGAPGSRTVTDSAGVRVVEYENPASWGADLPLHEVTRVGSTEGPSQTLFSELAGGRILRDGTIVVADRIAGEVRQFSRDGELIRAHGREGEGPGEYVYIRGMGNCTPGGFTVFDLFWTMSLYDESGAFVEERPPGGGPDQPYELACSRSGHLATIGWGVSGPQPGFHVARARLRVLDSTGVEVADLGERIASERFGRSGGSGPHPAGRGTKLAFHGQELIVADGSFFGFERWSLNGELKELTRIDVSPLDRDSLMSEYLADALANATDENARRRIRERAAEMEGPNRATYSSDLMAGEDFILVREPVIGRTGRWFAFEANGEPVGFLDLPDGARLLDIQGNELLVEELGSFDVPQAVLYRMELGGSAPN